MTEIDSVQCCIDQDDPASEEVVKFLLAYREEDERLDYKVSADINSEKMWLELAKDLSAFANTYGGYLLFGVNGTCQ